MTQVNIGHLYKTVKWQISVNKHMPIKRLYIILKCCHNMKCHSILVAHECKKRCHSAFVLFHTQTAEYVLAFRYVPVPCREVESKILNAPPFLRAFVPVPQISNGKSQFMMTSLPVLEKARRRVAPSSPRNKHSWRVYDPCHT